MDKAPDAFRTISEVAEDLDVPQHVLRFWESRFREIKPMKRGGGRRYYRPDDVELLRGIRHLLVIPCLLLTFLFGPAGWLLYMAIQTAHGHLSAWRHT